MLYQRICITILLLFPLTFFAQSVSLDFHKSNQTISEEPFGYNPGWLMYYHFLDSGNASTFNTPPNNCQFENEVKDSLIEYMDRLPGNVLRFPSGTGSQFYHFDTLDTVCGTARPGSGFEPTEIALKPNTFNLAVQGWESTHERNIIYDMVDMVKATEARTGKPYKVLFAANLLQHWFNTGNCGGGTYTQGINGDIAGHALYQQKFDENMAALTFLLDQGIDVAGVELGNEMYLFNDPWLGVCGLGINVDDHEYAGLAMKYARDMRSHPDPRIQQIPIGFVAAPNNNTYNANWNQTIADSLGQNPIIDGLIIHHYHKHTDGLLDEYDVNAGEFNAFLTDFNSNYNPGNLPLWITEYNDKDQGGIDNNLRMASSMLALSHNLKQYRFDSNQPNTIEYYIVHNLGAKNANGLALLDMQYSGNDTGNYVRPNNTFYPWYLLHREGNLWEPEQLTYTYDQTGADSITLRPYISRAGTEIIIQYANPSGSDIDLDLSGSMYEGSALSGWVVQNDAELLYYNAPDANSDILGLNDAPVNLALTAPKSTSGSITFPAYSFGTLKLLNAPTGLSSPLAADLKVFPNPGNGQFQVTCTPNTGGTLEWELLDISGRTLDARTFRHHGGHFSADFDYSNLPAGLYFFRLKNGPKLESGKIVIGK